MPLPDQEVLQLLDDTVEASKEQLLEIKKAHAQLATVTADRAALQVKVAALQQENETLKSQSGAKAASTSSLPVEMCNGIAESLVGRGILSASKQAAFASNLSRDPALVKFAFEKLAERIPLTATAQGSALVATDAHFQAVTGGDSGTPWM